MNEQLLVKELPGHGQGNHWQDDIPMGITRS
jgi:hypothetical protein